MINLLVQTACNYHQVVLFDSEEQKILADWKQETARETLSFLMRVLLELNQYSQPQQLIFIQGPGSFTALRVGATWVNTLVYAKGISTIAVDSLRFVALFHTVPLEQLAITFDDKRFFQLQDGGIIATEAAPEKTIINPEQEKLWFQQKQIAMLLNLNLQPQSAIDVLYIIPPKITQRKPATILPSINL